MGFFSYGHIPVSFVFQGQYDAVWGLLPVEKSRQRRTQAAELGCPGNIHGCCQSACPAILPAENQGKRNARTPARPVSCSDHDEAGSGNLPKFPGRFSCRTVQTAVRIPWLLQTICLLPPRRFGGHGALTRENGKRRGKTVQALSRAVCLFAPQYRLSFNFRFVQRKNPLSEGLSKFKVRVRKSKGALCP